MFVETPTPGVPAGVQEVGVLGKPVAQPLPFPEVELKYI